LTSGAPASGDVTIAGRSRNIFSLGRRKDDEDQLTEMLAWLISAVPAVGHRLIELALGTEQDAVDTDLRTQLVFQGGRLDAFLGTPSTAVVIESKLRSAYAKGQLRKYLDWIAAQYPGRTQALMTLTRDVAPWPRDDIDRAHELGIVSAPRRWEELHDTLAPLCDDPTDSSARLVAEFLEMLSDEGLVPIQPLSDEELGHAWNDSRNVIRRYHDFFRACKTAIGEHLGAEVISGSASDHVEYIWQDFRLTDATRIVVGIWFTDEGVPLKPPIYRHSPIVWMAVQGDAWPDWETKAHWLEENPPAGWRPRKKRWWGRPEVWCYLSEAVGSGTFDEQCERFARRCGLGSAWVNAALVREPKTSE
jgi:hypothetical protein